MLRDDSYAKRFGVALAIALAIHEVVFGLFPSSKKAPDERVASQTITITSRPTPTPRPRATPRPTPTPQITPTPPPQATFAPQVVVFAPAARSAATPRPTVGGAAARKRLVTRPHTVARVSIPRSLAAGTHAGQQNGGTGTGAGAGNGEGGLGGTGTGTSTSGNGNGGDANSSPCGDVYLLPGPVDNRHDGSEVQQVLAKVVLRDGTVQVDRFPYPFVYPRHEANPFVSGAGVGPDNGIPIQLPPPGADVSTFPPAVAVVLKYTDAGTGRTTLPSCPPPGAEPAAPAAPAAAASPAG